VDPSTLSGPFFAMMLLTLVVWLTMYFRRIRFLNSVSIDPDTLTPAKLAEISPPTVANPSDNLKNLFEMPVIFYALVLYLLVTGTADGIYVTAAWTFAGFRVLHSAVHCTVNIVMLRFTLYALSSLALWFMVLRAVLSL